jgi:lysophospholipase L1-like esterase
VSDHAILEPLDAAQRIGVQLPARENTLSFFHMFERGLHVALCTCLVVANASLLSALILQRANTLQNNGHWQSSKVDLELGVVGAVSFVTTRNALYRNRLDLGAWHGYQEVLYRDPVAVGELTLRFRLTKGGYFVLLLGRSADSFFGVRLSADPAFDSACLAGTREGGFAHRDPLELEPLDGRWHRVTARAGAGTYRISLDGREIGRCGTAGQQPTLFGLRGGPRRGTLVDDIVVRTVGGGDPIREDFSNRKHRTAIVLAALLSVMALAALALALSRRSRAKARAIPVEATLLTLLLMLLMTLAVDTLLLWPRYPERVDFRGFTPRIENESAALRRLADTYPAGPPATDVRRLLFLGSSQTWGAGAARTEHAWIARLERRWNEEAPPGVRYELINAGISALRSRRTRELYENHWIAWQPEAVVVVLGHNDDDPAQLGRELAALARTNRERGIRTVFIPEPESLEKPPGRRHEAIRAVAPRHGAALLEVHDALNARANEGFLWWDRIHLTSFGNELMAEEVGLQRDVILPR